MPHNHDEVVALLSRLAGVDYRAAPGDWDRALELLNLALDYQPTVALVLAEGRWRQAANVRAYVATAAVRLAVRLGIDPRQGEVLESPVRLAQGSGEPAGVDSLAHYVDAEGELVDVVETSAAGGPAPTPWARQSDDLRPARGEMIREVPRWLRKRGGGINWRLLADILAPHMRGTLAAVLRARGEGLRRKEVHRRGRSKAVDAGERWLERHGKQIAVALRLKTEREARRRIESLFTTRSTTYGHGRSGRARS